MTGNAITCGFVLFGVVTLILASQDIDFELLNLGRLWFDIVVGEHNRPFVYLLGLCSVSVAIFSQVYFRSKGFSVIQNLMLFLFGIVTLLVFTSTNIFAFLIFFEATSLFSFSLIRMAKHQFNRRAANIVLTTTLISGLGLIYAISWIYLNYGITDVRELSQIKVYGNIPLYIQAALIFGIMGKSPLLPVGFWLISAMAAEAPVSAYLHSATLVKLGLYAGWLTVNLWHGSSMSDVLMLLSSLSAVYYSYKAFYSDNLKIGLAYSTLSSIAMLTYLLSKGEYNLFVVLLLSHGVYKSTLFVIFGVYLMRSRSVSVTQVGIAFNRLEKLLIFAPLFALLGLSPFATAYVKKHLILDFFNPSTNFILSLGVFGSLLYSASFGVRILISLIKKECCVTSRKGLLPLFVACFLVIISQTALSLAFPEIKITLTGIPQMISYAILVASLFLALYHPTKDHEEINFSKLTTALSKLRSTIASYLQSERYTSYLAMFLVSVLMLFAIIKRSLEIHHIQLKFSATLLVFLFLVLTGTLLAVRSKSRLKTVMSIALLGLAVNLSFLLYGAPDLALTSFFVDMLWLGLITISLTKLPPFHPVPTVRFQTPKFAVALFFGVTMFLLALEEPVHAEVLKTDYLIASKVLLKAENAVNAIVTGFRAFDTLGEILVLTLCGIGFSILFSEQK